MAEGRVKWFDPNQGFGFIEREGKKDLFLHISQWRGAQGTVPQAGETVLFEFGLDPQGEPEAREVRPIDDESGESG